MVTSSLRPRRGMPLRHHKTTITRSHDSGHGRHHIRFSWLPHGTLADGTVGIENALGNDGLQVVYNADYLTSGMAIRFSAEPPVPWLTVAPEDGVVAPEGAQLVDLTADATGMSFGAYHAEMILDTNDLMNPQVVVPVTLTVTDLTDVDTDATPRSFALHGARPNPFNPVTTISFSLPHDGIVELSCLVDRNGIRPTRYGKLPPQCAALCDSNMRMFDLAATACIERSREAAAHALMVDPLTMAVCSPGEILQMTNELFEAEKDYLPGY